MLGWQSAIANTYSSTAAPTHLIELYTSEGCSSCPPADQWLANLKSHPQLFKAFVPLGFHVDYWDYIGWKDRFAKPEFKERQRRYTQIWQAKSAYTPGFVLNGKEWRDRQWRRAGKRSIPTLDTKRTAGQLNARQTKDLTFVVAFKASARLPAGKKQFHAALLSGPVASQVTAGENNGRKLEHGFVVLEHQSVDAKIEKQGLANTTFTFSKNRQAAAVAFWIEQLNSQLPLQATGGWLNKTDPDPKKLIKNRRSP